MARKKKEIVKERIEIEETIKEVKSKKNREDGKKRR